MVWGVSFPFKRYSTDKILKVVGLGTLHAWQSFGDNVSPDLQAVAKGLGGGSVSSRLIADTRPLIRHAHSYGSIGALLMSKKIADGIRDASGFWKHGHTYQVRPFVCYFVCEAGFIICVCYIGAPSSLCSFACSTEGGH